MTQRLRDSLGLMLGRRPPALQVGALCLDVASGKVLMITSRGTGRWIIPKGWPMPGRSLAQAAMQEAWEEAGAQGVVSGAVLGRYHYGKAQDRGYAIPVEVQVFLVRVEALADDYPEASQRSRRWFSPAKAAALVDEPGLAQILRGLCNGKTDRTDVARM